MEYPTPTEPPGTDKVVMASVDSDTVNGYVTYAVLPEASVSSTSMEPEPEDVGVPDRTPVEEFSVIPDGNPPTGTVH